MKIHTRTATCTPCDKIFENDRMLKCHMKTHTQIHATDKKKNNDNEKEKCHICNKDISKNNMSRHISAMHVVEVFF